eukprot:scaffold313050_cov41-Tisochrysis_lutea.AAC.1
MSYDAISSNAGAACGDARVTFCGGTSIPSSPSRLLMETQRAEEGVPVAIAINGQRNASNEGKRRMLASALLGASLIVFILFARTVSDAPAKVVDSSTSGITPVITTGDVLSQIPTGVKNDLNTAYTSNPLYWDPHQRDHVMLAVSPSNENCGSSGKELIRPFYVNSASDGDPSSFKWCDGGTCLLTLEMGGDTLHHDVGYLKLRGCPVKEGYTVPYLRIMKVLMGSYDVLHLGWGACDQGETKCEVGNDIKLTVGECKTLYHPSKPAMKYDVCYHGPGHY